MSLGSFLEKIAPEDKPQDRPDDQCSYDGKGKVFPGEMRAGFGIGTDEFFYLVGYGDAHFFIGSQGVVDDLLFESGVDDVVIEQAEEVVDDGADHPGDQDDEDALGESHVASVGFAETEQSVDHHSDEYQVAHSLKSPAEHVDVQYIGQKRYQNGGYPGNDACFYAMGKDGRIVHDACQVFGFSVFRMVAFRRFSVGARKLAGRPMDVY